jgi:hypothetical protein
MYYSSSGRVPGWGWALAIGSALPATIFYSLFYVFFLAFMPVIYLNFVGPVALGYLLGAVALLQAWLGHSRSERKLCWLAGGMGVLAWYLNWVGYAAFAIEGHGFLGQPWLMVNLFIQPHILAEVVAEIYMVGRWSIGTSGVPIFGWPLAIIWTLEAATIIGLPVLFLRTLRLHPYSEAQGRWYRHRRLLPLFENVAAKQMFTAELEAERLGAISRLDYGLANFWRGWPGSGPAPRRAPTAPAPAPLAGAAVGRGGTLRARPGGRCWPRPAGGAGRRPRPRAGHRAAK